MVLIIALFMIVVIVGVVGSEQSTRTTNTAKYKPYVDRHSNWECRYMINERRNDLARRYERDLRQDFQGVWDREIQPVLNTLPHCKEIDSSWYSDERYRNLFHLILMAKHGFNEWPGDNGLSYKRTIIWDPLYIRIGNSGTDDNIRIQSLEIILWASKEVVKHGGDFSAWVVEKGSRYQRNIKRFTSVTQHRQGRDLDVICWSFAGETGEKEFDSFSHF